MKIGGAALAVCMALLAFAALGLWQWQWDSAPLVAWIQQHQVPGVVIYVVAVAASVVLLPLSSLPLLPFAAQLYGIWLTALLSAAGWWVGALIAFQVARLGRRYLQRFVSLQAVDRLERRIPDDVGFGGIVVLRMILPVDIVSFALGLLKELRFSKGSGRGQFNYAIAVAVADDGTAFAVDFGNNRVQKWRQVK